MSSQIKRELKSTKVFLKPNINNIKSIFHNDIWLQNIDDKKVVKIQSAFRAFHQILLIQKLRKSINIIKRNYRDYITHKRHIPITKYKEQIFIANEKKIVKKCNAENNHELTNLNLPPNNLFNSFFSRVISIDFMIHNDEVYSQSWGKEIINLYKILEENKNTSIKHICLGSEHTLCLSYNGNIYSFGWNNYYQCSSENKSEVNHKELSIELDNPSTYFSRGDLKILHNTNHFQEVPIPNNMSIQSISCGEDYSLFSDSTGILWGFGLNLNGQLGENLNHKIVNIPTKIEELSSENIISVKCSNTANLAINDQGEISMWPWRNKEGKFFNTPIHLKQLCIPKEKESFKSISCGYNFVILLSSKGLVYSMGNSNKFGQLGLGHKETSLKPKLIESLTKNKIFITQISCGSNHTLAKAKNGELYTWGLNNYGQLSLDKSIQESIEPVRISLIKTKVIQIATGFCSSYILSDNSDVLMSGRINESKKVYGFQPVILRNMDNEEITLLKINCSWNKCMSVLYCTYFYGEIKPKKADLLRGILDNDIEGDLAVQSFMSSEKKKGKQ